MVDDPPIKPCKGLVFRYSTSSYLSKHGSIEIRQSMRLLKRQSCTGCTNCGWMMDDFEEWITDHDLNHALNEFADGDTCKLHGEYSAPSAPHYDDGDADFWFVKM